MAMTGNQVPRQFSPSSLTSDEDLNVFCAPCDTVGRKLLAFGFCQDCNEHLCESCISQHKKATPTIHRTLLHKDAIPKTLMSYSMSSHVTKPNSRTILCLKHNNKMIEFYCHDHRHLLCDDCVTLEHTVTSCHVDFITEISDQVVDSQTLKDTLVYMDTVVQHCQKVTNHCKKIIEKSNSSLIEVLEEIKNYRQEVNIRIDELEKEVENRAKLLQLKNDQRLETTNTVCDDVIKSVTTLSDDIKQSNATRQADKLFMELKTAETEMKGHETCINELIAAATVKVYHFKANPTIATVFTNEISLGTLEQEIISPPVQKLNIQAQNPKTLQKTKMPAKLFSVFSSKPYIFSHQGEICVKTTTNNGNKCWVTGMTLLNPDQLVIADYNTKSVKVIDTNSKTVTSEITLSSWPRSVTSVTNDQVAVTLPGKKTIQFLSVTSNKLSQTHSLKVDGLCCGISYYQNKLVLSYDRPGKLEILNMKGKVITTVKTNADGENIFMQPEYVLVNSCCIYVSDSGTRTVTIFNWQGEETGSYRDLGECRGLALSADGIVFVCDNNKNNIVEISSDCCKEKVVIKDVNRPQALCWCEMRHKLYASSWSGAENIQIFKKS